MPAKKDEKPKDKPPEPDKPIEGDFKEQGEMALAVPAPKEVALSTQDPVEFLERAVRQADALKRVIDAKKLAIFIGGGTKAHVLIDGWQTLMALNGVMPFTLSVVQTRCVAGECQVTKDCRGQRLTVHVVTQIRRVSDGTELTKVETECSQHESRWARSDDYAVLSMAQTRGVGKGCRQLFGWVMALAGYNATPAEEMPQTGPRRDDEDPGPPTEPQPAPVPTGPAPTSAQASAERQKAGGVSDSEYAHLLGWPELAQFHRFSVSHGDDPRVPLFRKYMNDHGFGKWSELAARWNDVCWFPPDKDFGSTIAQEIATLIMPMGYAPDKALPTTPRDEDRVR